MNHVRGNLASEVAEYIEGDAASGLLLIADHASNRIPGDISLGVPSCLLDEHVAVDIGVDALSRALTARLRCPAVLARVSRLVVDLNREADEPGAIPTISDGYLIPGNEGLGAEQRQARIDRFWRPYHAFIDSRIDALQPRILLSVHSFTPQLASRPDEARPWQIGILYNEDERAARIAIDELRAQGVISGDNEPYSGQLLNATMNRHAEGRGLAYLGIEVRQDLIARRDDAARWADRLAPVIDTVSRALA
ncbi:MAG: N-formylglutamate amidohydrolase [Sphingomonadales bacterium]